MAVSERKNGQSLLSLIAASHINEVPSFKQLSKFLMSHNHIKFYKPYYK